MNLISIMKECTKEQLEKKGFEFTESPEWVSIELNGEEYESNRYDVSFDNELMVYIYFDESSNFIYAIDDITKDIDFDASYMLIETPILSAIESLNLLNIH